MQTRITNHSRHIHTQKARVNNEYTHSERACTPHTHNRQNLGIFCPRKCKKKCRKKCKKINKLNKPYKLELTITHDTYMHKKRV